ncbi:hypothetical protein [Lignipirellula cremea]|uniref:Uncharacterized protein n=1 Tax=Lignipirellula cremea TaxID=2528010 RepID=A0A518DSG8_9BACT|nr:hypothetical protein [Lignipirellula cremea]QDU94792.1 hypothetical protein Pla8534_25990 [Lignipirellula cremea]
MEKKAKADAKRARRTEGNGENGAAIPENDYFADPLPYGDLTQTQSQSEEEE